MEEKNSHFRKLIVFLLFPFYTIARKYTKSFNRTYDILVGLNMLYIAAIILFAVYYFFKLVSIIVYG